MCNQDVAILRRGNLAIRSLALLLLAFPLAAQNPDTNSSPAGLLNAKLPTWLKFGGDYRARLEGFENGAFKPGNNDVYLLNRVRLDVTVKPTSWFRFYAQGQDARAFWKKAPASTAPFQDTFNLRQSYVEIGSGDTWSIKTGRQEINFGEQRLVGSLNWANTARSYDGVVGTVRINNIRATAFASSVVDITKDGVFHHHTQGNNLHGVYISFEKLIPNAVIEPYWFWRLSPTVKNEAGQPGKLGMHTAGVRFVGKLDGLFDYNVEMDRQTGHRGTDHISAWAGHWQVSRPMVSKRWQPVLTTEYNYASGDGRAKDGSFNTFDPMYPTPHDRYGLADQVGWRNIHHLRAGLEVKPLPRLRLQTNYHTWWLADSGDALYALNGSPVAVIPDGSGGSHVGQEIDALGLFDLNKQTQVGFGVGHIFPGEFLKAATPGQSYTFPYVMLQYKF